MNKTAKILLLILAAFFLFLGIKSSQHSKSYAELTDIQTIKGTIFQLHCPPKGAASLSIADSDLTYNLSVKFRSDYCDEKKSPVLIGKEVTMQSVQVNGKFHQVYQIENNGRVILRPDDVLSDQTSATLGLFFLAFLLIALVLYKSRPVRKNT
ncbi:hypothetical protein ESZ36_06825 [Colwellia demingiae]|uniref:Uncharacterized protein n=1 Tax=Colwellia demingiae TaxID=89401 RepID=A0A5C6QLY9_9GAMM|nr:hypothetical protein [Colwellia demingiae]TWX69660.1 hypothetical protein ESZ36_06825 [Colwellia demingiae]